MLRHGLASERQITTSWKVGSSVAQIEMRPDSHGKVRDIYDCGDKLLMVASDRISAFDFILPDEIPHKGEIQTRISVFWFYRFKDLMPNHMISCDVADLPEEFQQYSDYLAGRSMLVKKAQTVPIECIVRGYLTGSGKKTYDQDGTVCGIKLPEGLTEASKLPEPIFTPSTKAELGDHDENISFERCCEIVGTDVATQLRDASLAIYKAAAEYAATRGIIIPDTAKEKPCKGQVIATGPGKVLENGTRVELAVKKGDQVLFNKYAGTEVKLDGIDHLVMREEDILAILTD